MKVNVSPVVDTLVHSLCRKMILSYFIIFNLLDSWIVEFAFHFFCVTSDNLNGICKIFPESMGLSLAAISAFYGLFVGFLFLIFDQIESLQQYLQPFNYLTFCHPVFWYFINITIHMIVKWKQIFFSYFKIRKL